MPTRQQNIEAMEHVLKTLFDLDEADGLHVILNRSAKFGIEAFLLQTNDELRGLECVTKGGEVMRMQNHEVGLLKQLRDYKHHLVSQDSTLDPNFDYAAITKEGLDNFRCSNDCYESLFQPNQSSQ